MNTQKHWIALIAAGAALLAGILACDLSAPPAPYDIYVTTTGADTNDCRSVAHACRTVAAAINKSVTAGNVIIGAGTFPVSNLAVDKFITIKGHSQATTILASPDNTNPAIKLMPYVVVTIQDLTISRGNQGIQLFSHVQFTGTNLAITGANFGIVDDTTSRSTLSNITVTNSARVGVFMVGLVDAGSLIVTGSHDGGVQAGGNMTLENVTIQHDNYGILTTPARAGGAARLTITGGTIANNATVGISNVYSVVSVTGVTITANGTGISNQGPSTVGSLSLTNSSVSNNTGDGIGNSAIMSLENVVVQGNHGRGVDAETGSMQIDHTAIIQNVQSGLYTSMLAGNPNNVSLANVTISGNRRYGIEAPAGNINASFITVASNTLAGLSQGGASVSLQNSIVALNAAPNCTGGGTAVLNAPNLACDDTLTAARLLMGPLGMEAGTFVMPLQLHSPAIDAAGGTCVTNDQRGYTRPYGRACDIGAYEFGAGAHDTFVTPGPTETPAVLVILPTDTPTPTAAPLASLNKNANCRKGPGTGYDIVTSLMTGTQTTPDGRDGQNLWLDVLVPNTQAHCWVLGSSVDLNVPVDTLAVLPAPPLPDAPSGFTDHADCQAKLKKLSVKLSWSDGSNETGYHLYRNGKLLETLGANVTVFVDGSAQLGKDLTYELEAFNGNGSSGRTQTTVSACK